MKIIAFAASSSTKSINKKLVTHASSLLENVNIEILDLNDYELPMFSEDKEMEIGQPECAKQVLAKITEYMCYKKETQSVNGSLRQQPIQACF